MDNFIDTDKLYPMLFSPIYQYRIWGGTLMRGTLHREPPAGTGESWEVSDRDDAESVVANGEMAGATLNQLVLRYGTALLGSAAPDGCRKFPLLVKLIDAGERLSLQVHPDADTCRKLGGDAEPKTEMWYVIDALPDSVILAGLGRRATRQLLETRLHRSDVEELFNKYISVPGDAYFITAGTPHAIGAGNLILEIQQNSDTTYRLSDWGRVDSQGKARELHVAQGMQSIHFTGLSNPRIAGVYGKAPRNRLYEIITRCPWFYVCDLHLAERWNDDTKDKSFHLLSAIRGSVTISRDRDDRRLTVRPGQTALVPANYGVYHVDPETADEETVVLKCTL